VKANRLTPAELDAIAYIVERGGLSSDQHRKLRDAVRYRRFNAKAGRWLRPRISGVYRLALDLWPRRQSNIARNSLKNDRIRGHALTEPRFHTAR
jgi:hypothetical protein